MFNQSSIPSCKISADKLSQSHDAGKFTITILRQTALSTNSLPSSQKGFLGGEGASDLCPKCHIATFDCQCFPILLLSITVLDITLFLYTHLDVML